jgi:hypothetical protein
MFGIAEIWTLVFAKLLGTLLWIVQDCRGARDPQGFRVTTLNLNERIFKWKFHWLQQQQITTSVKWGEFMYDK